MIMLEKSIRQQRVLFFLSDLLATLAAFWIAYLIRFHFDWGIWKAAGKPLDAYARLSVASLCIWVFVYHQGGLYRPDFSPRGLSELWRFLRSAVIAVVILFALTYALRIWVQPARPFVFIFALGAVVLAAGGRHLLRRAASRGSRGGGMSVRRVLIIGAGTLGRTLADGIRDLAVFFQIVGFLDDHVDLHTEPVQGLKVLGRLSELESCIRQHAVDEVIIALPASEHDAYDACMEACLRSHIVWKIVPSQYELLLDRISVQEVGGVPLIGMKTCQIIGFNYLIKRVIDIAASLLILLFFLPLMVMVAALIKISSPGPILFRQTRIGYKHRPFQLLKFRSMLVSSDDSEHRDFVRDWIADKKDAQQVENGTIIHKITNDKRVTPVGRLIRKFSIDELPQIFNVLRGDMSLIGPRPPLPYEIEHYKEWHKRRLDAPPGITGLWQVSGRNRLNFDEMVRLDLYYIENWSLEMDFKIAVRTLLEVLFGNAY